MWRRVLQQLRDLLILVLLVAAALTIATGDLGLLRDPARHHGEHHGRRRTGGTGRTGGDCPVRHEHPHRQSRT
ncbi:hypothetical protein ACE1N8_00980 [Streptomyces sp. DSM 116494]|uniref:hypothetical protein n=1 Tax=Streptomyces okerensis TaxID=3344655 RepID=UPI00388F6135